ncbi:hypothetical protein ACRRTK_001576 [Alexandromys fortis]
MREEVFSVQRPIYSMGLRNHPLDSPISRELILCEDINSLLKCYSLEENTNGASS